MTSKEALEKLSYIPIYEEDEHYRTISVDSSCIYQGELCEVYGSEVDTIKKELEVLEILKKWIVVNETYDDLFPYEIKVKNGYVSNRSCLILTEEDYRKIKEWLDENNKQ